MTKDLEETLAEMGPAYRAVVDRLVASEQAAPSAVGRIDGFENRRWGWGRAAYVRVAASLLVCAGLVGVFLATSARRAPADAPKVYTIHVATAARAYRLAQIRDDAAVQEMIRTQRPDGSWKNDFLTRQNAAALMHCKGEAAQVAFRKAIRHLRAREAQ